jgi:cytochrome c553
MRNILTLTLLCAGLAGFSTQAADVKENWTKHCAKCHGEDGKGQTTMGKKLKAKDYTDAKIQEAMKDEDMFKATKEGVKEAGKTTMKGFGDVLSDQEIKDLVAFIRKLKK